MVRSPSPVIQIVNICFPLESLLSISSFKKTTTTDNVETVAYGYEFVLGASDPQTYTFTTKSQAQAHEELKGVVEKIRTQCVEVGYPFPFLYSINETHFFNTNYEFDVFTKDDVISIRVHGKTHSWTLENEKVCRERLANFRERYNNQFFPKKPSDINF